MLLVREDKFVKDGDKLYIVGSPSNDLYYNNAYAMGHLKVLSWIMPREKYDISKLEEYKPNDNIELRLYDYNLSFKKKLKIIKNEVKNSSIVVAKLSIIQAIISCHYARKYKKKLIIESASDALAAFWHHGGNIKYKLVAHPIDMLAKHYHKKADAIVYVSQLFLQNKYPSKKEKIGCSDTVLATPKISDLDRRINKIYSKPSDEPFVLGLIGATQAEYRGHDRLIKAAAILKKRGYNIKIKFLGGGTADEKRKKCALKNDFLNEVEFCGRLPHSQVLDWLDNIDILCMPTMVESLGRAAIEAMSRGCPVIGTVETALAELLNGDSLIKAKDYLALANKIEYFISNNKILEYTAKDNFYRSFKFTSEYTNEIRRDFYQKLVKKYMTNK